MVWCPDRVMFFEIEICGLMSNFESNTVERMKRTRREKELSPGISVSVALLFCSCQPAPTVSLGRRFLTVQDKSHNRLYSGANNCLSCRLYHTMSSSGFGFVFNLPRNIMSTSTCTFLKQQTPCCYFQPPIIHESARLQDVSHPVPRSCSIRRPFTWMVYRST